MRIITKIFSVILLVTLLTCTVSAADKINWYFKKTLDHSQPKLDSYLAEAGKHKNLIWIDKENDRFDSDTKKIYITFDAGYENGNIEKILDILKEENVKATFFILENLILSNRDLVERMINEGHIVGNHSDTHPNFSKIDRTQMVKEIENLDNYLRQHFGYSSPFFRFPEGACSENALELVQSIGYTSVFWSSAYADWDINNPKGKQYAFETVTARLHPGCILLLHAVSKDNAEALGDIIDYAKEQGYEFKAL